MKACITTFRSQKAGNSESEYEDAAWPAHSCEQNLPLRIAAADGASDAVFSGLWAEMLVRSWGRGRLNAPDFSRRVGRLGRAWRRTIRDRQLPWYVEEKARAGSYAAFIGLALSHTPGSSSGSWSAVACGDCCFFQLRESALITAFPVSQTSDFSSTPPLLTSDSARQVEGAAVLTATGSWEENDSLYLMTDALACWFLASCETGVIPWRLLTEVTLTQEPPFEQWLAKLRGRREIRNDDCTLLNVTFE